MDLHLAKNTSFSQLINDTLLGQCISGMIGVGIGLVLGSYFGLL